LKDSLESNTNIIDVDVRNNQLSEGIEREINEIVTKNLLMSKKIPYQRVPERKLSFHNLKIPFRVHHTLQAGKPGRRYLSKGSDSGDRWHCDRGRPQREPHQGRRMSEKVQYSNKKKVVLFITKVDKYIT
jgi:hypothetical protein